MKIKWDIKKKRGHFRPSLNYHIRLESFEKALAVPAVRIQSLIPEIPNSHLSFCMPLENERCPGWEPVSYHPLSVPYFKHGETHGFIRLPFRNSREYPEVEESFKILRREYECIVLQAYSQGPVCVRGELDISTHTRTNIAAAVTARKMLGLCLDG